MGARKRKGCRNNILILNGIIHEVVTNKKTEPVVLQIYDYRQMFDAISLEEAISDAFDVGIKDDDLILIYKANREIQMAINTPNGLTNRQSLSNVVLQGDTWGSLLASIQVDKICKDVESSGYGYKFKNILPVSMLALVDDMVGITSAGFTAQQMNAAINVKTAEKRLQFGVSKCKSMVIGNDKNQVINNPITVDKWKVEFPDVIEDCLDCDKIEKTRNGSKKHSYKEHVHKQFTCQTCGFQELSKRELMTHVNEKHVENNEHIVESYDGVFEMDNTGQQKYLGFILSNKGDNMKNIGEMRKRSVWIINNIFNKIKSLNLRKYYFECSMLFLNVLLRSSILYAAETYYNMKENEIRALERIEEHFIRKLLNTTRACPISQLYLEVGQQPARFEIIRRRLLFFKDILNEKPESLIFRFIMLQFEKPTKGDWASSCLKNLEYLNIELSVEEIKLMKKSQFKKIIENAIKEKAFEYLIEKRGSKGSLIRYSSLKMQEYLLPDDENLSITDKQYIFAIRNRMVQIEYNFPKNGIGGKECVCGENENMEHIYSCKRLNTENKEVCYERIFGEDVRKMKIVYERFRNNLEKSKKYEDTMLHGIPFGDPLYECTVVDLK